MNEQDTKFKELFVPLCDDIKTKVSEAWMDSHDGATLVQYWSGASEAEKGDIVKALESQDWEYFGIEVKPSVDSGAKPIERNLTGNPDVDKYAATEANMHDTSEPTPLVMQSPEKVTDEELKAILKAKGYKAELVPDYEELIIDLESIRLKVPAGFIAKNQEDVASALEELVMDKINDGDIEVTVESWERDDA
jgi:hypothetical protein